ncbi:anaerobic glycerol-3-phosphate dehydrogenase subunit GlpA [Salisediminibacterium halotolerans]|uniref:Aerobic glycerol-3-phosphate dehydrogenase n=1 Tax=Salisediminibacterium halotolerans TaxID=517425 RepID=A0A1H9V0T0_9BACI|nr:anaerobic glycerol-3-phosphate dehydrogenase subunit GlpA [Salisediminibacterium haloalkalitolerans]SES15345.1 glycerol-3-phosphate dehydrogenase [Salisediminibacterium haloalkalitolerans]
MTARFETDVVIIGGGVTGAGVVRDLTLRGIRAILVEQQDVVHGTSSRNHGLLHSGGRYAVRDENAAIESYRENLILKETVPGSIEQTGGLFVKVPGDDDDYVRQWLKSCEKVGIPTEEVSVKQALKEEPYLNRDAEAVFRVPDGAVDPFTLTADVIADAADRGGGLLRYHEVTSISRQNGQVESVTVQDRFTGELKQIETSIVINAAGPWAAHVARMADVPMELINNKGTLTVLNQRINRQVINRLRMPGDADIFVPAHNVTIFGTTGVNVDRPDDTSLDRDEIREMIQEGAALVPEVENIRMIRAFSGSRPLYQEKADGDASGRGVTRGMALLDHEKRDGLGGFITISGGKLTTFRYMAEKTADLAAEKLGVQAECTTDREPVPHRVTDRDFSKWDLSPAAQKKVQYWAGTNVERLEKSLHESVNASDVICECEQVTWAELEADFPEDRPFHLGDLRRRTRLGMGTCQGTFCHQRAAALAVENGYATNQEAEAALVNALETRKKGMTPLGDEQTRRQTEMMDAIYCVSLGMQKEGESNV